MQAQHEGQGSKRGEARQGDPGRPLGNLLQQQVGKLLEAPRYPVQGPEAPPGPARHQLRRRPRHRHHDPLRQGLYACVLANLTVFCRSFKMQ